MKGRGAVRRSNTSICLDHQTVFPPYAVAEGTDTLDGIATSDEAELQSKHSDDPRFALPNVTVTSPEWGAQWEKQRDGLMAHKFALSTFMESSSQLTRLCM